jgi:hypothetical protein
MLILAAFCQCVLPLATACLFHVAHAVQSGRPRSAMTRIYIWSHHSARARRGHRSLAENEG